MALSFPTGHSTHAGLGSPGHARPCRCARPLAFTDSDECLRCGRLPKATIQQTWHERAEKIAERNRKRKARAAA